MGGFGTFVKSGALALALCFFLSSCEGNHPASPDPIVGTGDSFLGGGDYVVAVFNLRQAVERIFTLLQSRETLSHFCENVPGITPAKADSLRELAFIAAPSIVTIVKDIPIEVVPRALVVTHAAISYPVKGRFRPRQPNASELGKIELAQADFDAGGGLSTLAHELVHAAIGIEDFSPQDPEYSDTRGGYAKLNDLGQCTEAFYRDRVAHQGYAAMDFGAYGNTVGNGNSGVRIAVQSNGKVLVAATFARPPTDGGAIGNIFHVVVRRLSPTGRMDSSFGTNGEISLPVRVGTEAFGGKTARRIWVLSDDSFLVAGKEQLARLEQRSMPFLLKYDALGRPDDGFNERFAAGLPGPEGNQWFTDMAIDGKGRIVLSGVVTIAGQYHFGAWRVLSDGYLDSLFGEGGRAHASSGGSHDMAYAVAVGPGHSVVVAGHSTYSGPYACVGVARFKEDGSLDPSFNGTGTLKMPHEGTVGMTSLAESLVVYPTGAILVAGTRWAGSFSTGIVVRMKADGSLDPSFGEGGIATPIPVDKVVLKVTESAYSRTTLLPDGRLLLAGSAARQGIRVSVVARVLANGTRDKTFTDGQGNEGLTFAGMAAGGGVALDLVPHPSGRYIAAGICRSFGPSCGHFVSVLEGEPPQRR